MGKRSGLKIRNKIQTNRILFLIKLIKEESSSFFLLLIVQIIYKSCMPLIGTYISAYLIEQVVLSFNQNVNIVKPLCLQFGYFLLNSLYDTVYSLCYKLCSEQFHNGIKNRIMKKSRDIDMSFFDMPECYGKLENAKREVGSRPLVVMNSLCESISRFVSMIGYMMILVSFICSIGINALLVFTIFFGLAVYFGFTNLKYKNKNYQYMKKSSKQRRQMNYYSELVLNKEDVKEIKIYDLSDIFINKYNEVFRKYFEGIKGLFLREGKTNVTVSICMTVLRCILFYLIVVNVTSIENFTIYTSALNSISSNITILILNIANIYEGLLFIDNLRDFFNEESKMKETEISRQINREQKHRIEFSNVSFKYPGSNKYVLKNINLKMETGEIVVLIGLNGAGKSTLIKLLVRLYDPTEGNIFLDGYDIREYSLKELYKTFGVIFQDYGKYALSVKENICFGKGKQVGNLKGIINASVRANADEFIQGMENAYDTYLTRYFEEEGIDLSIGQWQKLALARLFYSNAEIKILDEPTASLDTETEQKIYSEMKKEGKSKLVVLISHKLIAVEDANQIILLKNGQIIESGKHDELIRNKGNYYQLYKVQNNTQGRIL